MSEMLCISRSEVTLFLSSSAVPVEIDASLAKMETIKHFTVVGECFVEGMMGEENIGRRMGPHKLALR